MVHNVTLLLLGVFTCLAICAFGAAQRPNVVIVFLDEPGAHRVLLVRLKERPSGNGQRDSGLPGNRCGATRFHWSTQANLLPIEGKGCRAGPYRLDFSGAAHGVRACAFKHRHRLET